MCVMVYIAAPAPLRAVPFLEEHPGFHLTEVPPGHEAIRARFTYPNVGFAGAHEGCGCGFQLGKYPDYESAEDLAEKRTALHAFADYLDEQLPSVGSIEVFTCWDGEQGEPIESRRKVEPEVLRDNEFFFEEKELLILSAPEPNKERQRWGS